MKKNGFTLVEILAVLVLISLIAILSVPSIINYINNSKNDISDATKQLIFSGAGLYIDNNTTQYPADEYKEYCVPLNDVVNANYLSAPIIDSVSGEEIDLSKFVRTYYSYDFDLLTYKRSYELVDSCTSKNYSCIVANHINESKELSVGAEIKCGGENFYVIPDHEEAAEGTVSLLAKYNLNVDTNLQSENNDSSVVFSTTNYWVNDEGWNDVREEFESYWAYNESSNLYQYVENYEQKLKENGLTSATATLLSYKVATDLGCKIESSYDEINDITSVIITSCEEAPSWISSVNTYWLGSVSTDVLNRAWHIHSDGAFCPNTGDNTAYAIRPVVIIPKENINNN